MLSEKNELRNLFNRIGGALLIFLLAFNLLCGGAASLQSLLTYADSSVSTYIITDLINSLAYIAAFSIPVWFFFKISKHKPIQPLGLSLALSGDQTVLSTLSVMFLGTSVCFATSYVNSLLAPISEDASELYFTSDLDCGYKLVLMFISTAIIPAFVEELLFRGLILSQIRPYSESGAILISAILFGLMHQTTFQFFYTTALGIILAIVCVKTGSIWMGVLLHFFNNFLSVIQSYLMTRFDERSGEFIYMIITLSVLVIGLILGTMLYLADQKIKSTDHAIAKRHLKLKKETAVFYKAVFSPTIIIYSILSVLTMISTALMIAGV